MPAATLLNGHPIEPGLCADRAFHFGDGLFETIAVVQGEPCLWPGHMQRLRKGCERLGIPFSAEALLRREARQLSDGQQRAVLKIIVSAGPGGHGYARAAEIEPTRWLQLAPWPQAEHYLRDEAVPVQWCETTLAEQPLLAGLKHLNRLEQVLARREVNSPAVEGLMCNRRGHVIEGTMSNLLLKTDGRYLTPSLEHCGVEGVVRARLLTTAAKWGESVTVGEVKREQVREADGLYLSNALLGIRPVSSLDGRVFREQHRDAFLDEVHRECLQGGEFAHG